MVRRFVANTGMEKLRWRDKQPRHAAKPCLQSNSETILNLGQYVNAAPVLLILYSGRELRNFCLPFSSSVFGSDDDAGTPADKSRFTDDSCRTPSEDTCERSCGHFWGSRCRLVLVIISISTTQYDL